LTRMPQGPWSGHTLLNLALRLLFTVAGGYLIVDDTVVATPYARLLGEAAWVWSNKDRKVLLGVSVVLMVWTDGQSRIPLAFRVWHKGGASKYDLALELLSYARNQLKCKPAFVLFDSWYPSKQLLKRIWDYGWYCVCPLKKTRSFSAHRVCLSPPAAQAPAPSRQAACTGYARRQLQARPFPSQAQVARLRGAVGHPSRGKEACASGVGHQRAPWGPPGPHHLPGGQD